MPAWLKLHANMQARAAKGLLLTEQEVGDAVVMGRYSVRTQAYGAEVDWYSMGVIVFEMLLVGTQA